MSKWSHKIHRMLVLWLSQIGLNRKIHYNEAIRTDAINDRFGIVLIILMGCSSFTSFINIMDFPVHTKTIISIVVGCVSMIACIATAIYNRMNLGEISQKHHSIALEYSQISNIIQTTAAAESKPDPAMFMRLITDRIDMIQRYGPPPVKNTADFADLPNYIMVHQSMRDRRGTVAGDLYNLDDIVNEEDINLYMNSSEGKKKSVDNTCSQDVQLSEIVIEEVKL